MITEWLLQLGTGFVAWMVATFPAWSVPEWFSSFSTGIQTVVGMASGMSAWVDMGLASTVVGAIVGTWVVCLGIKLALRAGAHIPGIGGPG